MKPDKKRIVGRSRVNRGRPLQAAEDSDSRGSGWGSWIWIFMGLVIISGALMLFGPWQGGPKPPSLPATPLPATNTPLFSETVRTNPPVQLSPTNLTATSSLPDPNTLTDAVEVLNFGTELLANGRITNAIAFYRRALELHPEDEEVHFNLAFAYARAKRLQDAVRHYNEALRIFPDYAEVHNNLGNLLVAQQQFEEASKHFSAAIKLQPENSSALNNLGRCLAAQNKPAEAIQYFTDALRLHTNYFEAQFNLANAFLSAGQYAEAISEFEKALNMQPNFLPAQQGLARAREKRAAAKKL